MEPTTAIAGSIADALGGLFNWFSNISLNNAVEKQQNVAEEQTQQSWFNNLMQQNAVNAAGKNTTIMVLALIFIVLIIAVVFIAKKPKK